jgi:hypothetical protein
VKRKFKLKPKPRLRVGVITGAVSHTVPELAAKGAVRWRNMPIRSGRLESRELISRALSQAVALWVTADKLRRGDNNL